MMFIFAEPAFSRRMTLQLSAFVTVMDGTNYQQWVGPMQSYLMAQGQWKCVKKDAAAPVEIKGEHGEVTNSTHIADWEELAEKALGNIRLRLHPTIGYQYNDLDNASLLW